MARHADARKRCNCALCRRVREQAIRHPWRAVMGDPASCSNTLCKLRRGWHWGCELGRDQRSAHGRDDQVIQGNACMTTPHSEPKEWTMRTTGNMYVPLRYLNGWRQRSGSWFPWYLLLSWGAAFLCGLTLLLLAIVSHVSNASQSREIDARALIAASSEIVSPSLRSGGSGTFKTATGASTRGTSRENLPRE